MPKATALLEEEAIFLRIEIEKKFLQENVQIGVLKKNSYRESYRGLLEHMMENVGELHQEISLTRLRKLFYNTDPMLCRKPEPANFGALFLDACYRYITNGAMGRQEYFRAQPKQEPAPKPIPQPPVKPVTEEDAPIPLSKQLGNRISTFFAPLGKANFWKGMLIGLAIGWVVMNDPRFLFWMLKQDYQWWVCEYEDGTKVYNNFRSYRTVAEVKDYFVGQLQGDCEAFQLDADGDRAPMCYDPYSAKEHFKKHGAIVSIRLDETQ